MKKRMCFDAYAILCYVRDQPGAQQVEDILRACSLSVKVRPSVFGECRGARGQGSRGDLPCPSAPLLPCPGFPPSSLNFTSMGAVEKAR